MRSGVQLSLFDRSGGQQKPLHLGSLKSELRRFCEFGRRTVVFSVEFTSLRGKPTKVETFVNEFWTSKQRAANSLHEVSYRACFKPQLPRFFIERLTQPGDTVYDPFMGRGTTLLEAALMGRVPIGCDINPLSAILIGPRLMPPTMEAIAERLSEINLKECDDCPDELLVFYHPDTLKEICSLRNYLLRRERQGRLDPIDAWIRMVAVNRLTGHSSGFFSVYTLPPNQAVSVASQRRINEKRRQVPPRRNVRDLILRKTKQLLSDCDPATRRRLERVSARGLLLTRTAAQTPEIGPNSVDLVVTSPPFLDVVDYTKDNWLRCWFCGIDPKQVAVTTARKLDEWQKAMGEVFAELTRILRPGGYVAFEVGEVRNGRLKLEEAVLPVGEQAGLTPVLVMINDQRFTKTAHCWGIENNRRGTNTNRIVLFRKD